LVFDLNVVSPIYHYLTRNIKMIGHVLGTKRGLNWQLKEDSDLSAN